MNAVEIQNVTKTFGQHTAVSDLSLQVPEGTIYGFIGPNGSGKTTTLRMIMHILHPDQGTIAVLGERSLQAACVIDCTGPGADVTQSTDPLMQTLLRAGIARPDPLRLGLDVAPDGAVLTGSGAPSRRLFAIGPLTKGASWEMTSVAFVRTAICRWVNASTRWGTTFWSPMFENASRSSRADCKTSCPCVCCDLTAGAPSTPFCSPGT